MECYLRLAHTVLPFFASRFTFHVKLPCSISVTFSTQSRLFFLFLHPPTDRFPLVSLFPQRLPKACFFLLSKSVTLVSLGATAESCVLHIISIFLITVFSFPSCGPFSTTADDRSGGPNWFSFPLGLYYCDVFC